MIGASQVLRFITYLPLQLTYVLIRLETPWGFPLKQVVRPQGILGDPE
jgi:hypothetical protein